MSASKAERYFFGRSVERARLQAWVRDGGVRVLVGLPGVGKTELTFQLEPVDGVAVLRVGLGSAGIEALAPLARAAGTASTTPLVLAAALRAHGGRFILEGADAAPAEVAALLDAALDLGLVPAGLLVVARVVPPMTTPPPLLRLAALDELEATALVEHLAARIGMTVTEPEVLARRGGGVPGRLRALLLGTPVGPDDDPVARLIEAVPAAARELLARLAACVPCGPLASLASDLGQPGALEALLAAGLVERRAEGLVVPDLVVGLVTRGLAEEVLRRWRREAAESLWSAFEGVGEGALAIESIGLSLRADPEGGAVALAMRRLMVAYPAIRRGGLVQLAVPLLTLLRGPGGEAGVAAGLRMLVFHSRIDDATALIAGRPSEDTNRFELALAQASLAIRRCELGAAEVALDQARELAASEDAGRQVLLGDSMVRALRGDLIGSQAVIDTVAASSSSGREEARRLARARALHAIVALRWREVLRAAAAGRAAAGPPPGAYDEFDLIAILAHAELGELGPLDVLAGRLASRWRRTPRAPVQALLLGVIDRASGAEDASLQLLDEARVQASAGGDVLMAALAAYLLAQAYLARGEFPRVEDLLRPVSARLAAGGVAHLAALVIAVRGRAFVAAGQPDHAAAVLAEAGDHAALEVGRVRALAAAARGDVLAARVLLPPALEGAGPQALGERSCDEALVEMMGGDPHRAQLAAEAAMAAIGDAALPYLRARSHLLQAAAAQARGDAATADAEASAAEALARARGYQPILRFLDLLRATRSAGRAVLDRTTLGLRGGLSGVLRVLGLDPSTLVVDTPSGRLHLGADGVAQLIGAVDLVVDTTTHSVIGPIGRIDGRPTVAAMLAALAAAGSTPVPADQLYRTVWGAPAYLPARHRNTLYVALGRVRAAVRPLGESRELILRRGDGWLLDPAIAVAVVRRDPRTEDGEPKA